MTEYTSVEDALRRIGRHARIKPGLEWISSLDAHGRILATAIRVEKDVPPFTLSHKDGFAVPAATLQSATRAHPAVLKVIGRAGAGERPRTVMGKGTAFQVVTGAGLPAGADAVLPVESVEVREGKISVGYAPKPGSDVYGAGEDMRKGQVILPKGHMVRAQDVGLLVALRIPKVKVRRKPVISVISTGSELTDPKRPKAGRMPDSHSPVFVRLCQRVGCDAVYLGVVGDDLPVLSRVLRKAVASSDMVLTLGGTSAGGRDYIVEAVSSLRPEEVVHGIRMDRGRVTGVASVNGTPILMMPGPIQAAMNAYFLLGVPLVEMLSGGRSSILEVPCILGAPWHARTRFSDFLKVVYVRLRKGAPLVAEPIVAETESIKMLVDADGYIVVPEEVKEMAAGTSVMIRLVPGFSSS